MIKEEASFDIKSWDNKDTAGFYEKIPVHELKAMAAKGGFDDCCDIKLVKDSVFASSSILDVGAGYGRILRYLVDNKYQGSITALERSRNFFRYLKDEFKNDVNLVNEDFMYWETREKYDVILFMWANISEFPKENQLTVIRKLISFLSHNGTLILETISHNLIPNNASMTFDKHYYVNSEYGDAYGYLPSVDEIQEYGNSLGMNVETIPYTTQTHRERFLHIICN